MSGRRATPAAYTYQFPPGSYTFTPPVPGRWKLVLWGPGASNTTAGNSASGAYAEISRPLTPGQPVALVVGSEATDTKATFADGFVVTAGAASTTTPGVATNGDVNLAGSLGGVAGLGTGGGAAGVGTNPGGGAPAMLPFRGGNGGGSGTPPLFGTSPGSGAGPGANAQGASGLVIAYLVSN